ncbi:amidohydrolase family protein [Aestuariivirga sp.]|uniref:amidohydrolase family protein n=1 Tax=Aestuariivirga sp. TaxID=2650926 RepID=UPI0039E21EA7
MTVFHNLRTPDGKATALTVSPDGRIAAFDDERRGDAKIDCGGRLLLPSLVEPHVHLDKTLWGEPWRPNTAGPTLKDMIANERAILKAVKTPIRTRAGALLQHMIAQGSLAVRSHIDVGPDVGLAHVEAMLDLREAWRHLVDLQFVAFPQTGLLIAPGTAELLDRALAMGIETVGGLDPAGIDDDPEAHLRIVFDLAVKHGVGVDIHLHDRGELGLWEIGRIADFTEATGLAGRVMISHAYCLGQAPRARVEGLARRLADLRISLMTSAPADIEIPPVAYLKEQGVTVCCGSDGIRDAWSPFGNGDMLERAFLLAFHYDWSKDGELAEAFDCATASAARAIGLSDYGLSVGAPANFMLVAAETLGEAVAARPKDRMIVRNGRLIAEAGKLIVAVP